MSPVGAFRASMVTRPRKEIKTRGRIGEGVLYTTQQYRCYEKSLRISVCKVLTQSKPALLEVPNTVGTSKRAGLDGLGWAGMTA